MFPEIICFKLALINQMQPTDISYFYAAVVILAAAGLLSVVRWASFFRQVNARDQRQVQLDNAARREFDWYRSFHGGKGG